MTIPGDNPGTAGALRDGPRGGKLRTGGTNPGAGRPTDEFKERMRSLAGRADTENYLVACLKGDHGPKAFMSALKHVTEQGYGKAQQNLAVTGDEAAPLVMRVIKE